VFAFVVLVGVLTPAFWVPMPLTPVFAVLKPVFAVLTPAFGALATLDFRELPLTFGVVTHDFELPRLDFSVETLGPAFTARYLGVRNCHPYRRYFHAKHAQLIHRSLCYEYLLTLAVSCFVNMLVFRVFTFVVLTVIVKLSVTAIFILAAVSETVFICIVQEKTGNASAL
jgi:hypothetical protein